MNSTPSSPESRATTLIFEGYKIPVRFNSQNRPLFFALPLCSAIGFRRSIKAVRVLVPAKNLAAWMDEPSEERLATPCVDERGMRKLVAASPLVRARRFGRWLPSALSEAQRSLGEPVTPSGAAGLAVRSTKTQPSATHNPFAARPIPTDLAMAASDFVFHAFFDGTQARLTNQPIPAAKSVFAAALSQDIADVVACGPNALTHALAQPSESHESSQGVLITPSILSFTFRYNVVRAVLDETRKPWFVTSDVVKVLGFDYAQASALVLESGLRTRQVKVSGSLRPLRITNVAGLFTLISKGRKLYTQEFRAWVVERLIPAVLAAATAQQADPVPDVSQGGMDAASAPKPSHARFVLDVSDPDKPSLASLPDPDPIDLDSDAWIEKVFASASQSQLKRVLRAVATRLV